MCVSAQKDEGNNIFTFIFCQTSFSCDDLASLKAPLDIPIPDPAKEEAKRKKKEEVCLVLCRFEALWCVNLNPHKGRDTQEFFITIAVQ